MTSSLLNNYNNIHEITEIRYMNNKEVDCSFIQMDTPKLTVESRNGQNFGFPLRPYLSKYAPFLSVAMACKLRKMKCQYMS